MELNENKLLDLLGKVVIEMGAAANGPLITIGDKLGLYKSLSESGHMTSAELASKTNTTERRSYYIRGAPMVKGFQYQGVQFECREDRCHRGWNFGCTRIQAQEWFSGFACLVVFLIVNLGSVVQAQSVPPDLLEKAKTRVALKLNREDAAFLLIAESSMMKVMPDRAPFKGRPGEPVEISVAGGETEGGQIIIAPINQALTNVTFYASKFVGSDGTTLPTGSVSLDVVGYVQTDPELKLEYEVDRAGWFPDPILPTLNHFDIERDHIQSLWLSVRVNPGQTPGYYVGSVNVIPENAPSETISVRIRVFDFSIPLKSSFPTAVTTFEDRLKRVYGDQWSEDLYWKYVDFLHEHRLDYDNFYREHEPPPTVQQIERMVAGGQQGWCLRYIEQPGEDPYGNAGVDPSEYPTYLDEAIEDAKKSLAVLEEAGARDLAYIYLFDEVRESHFETLLSTTRRLREELPGVPIWTSAEDKDFGKTSGLDEVIDNWLITIAAFNMPKWLANIEQAQENGAQVMWYTTPWPYRPFPNFMIEYDAIEPRLLMGAMPQKIRPDGFAFWAINWWFKEIPITQTSPYTNWNISRWGSNGDASWIVAGKDGPITTIRFENVRDGLEDYEYYQLLTDALEHGERQGAAQKLLDRARELLQVPDDIVRGLTDFTRDPRVFEHHRLEVAEAIEELLGLGSR